MKRFHGIGLALLAAFALGAIWASSAVAGPVWLVEEKAVEASLPAEVEGLLELIKFNGGGSTILNTIHCEGILDGAIGPPNAAGNGVDEVTKVLNLAMEETGTPLTGLALLCKVTHAESLFDCKESTEPLALVWPENLPWLSELELMETSTLDRLFKDASDSPNNTEPPAYEVECELGIGGTLSELCEGETSGEASNEAGTVPGAVLLLSTEANGTPRANCPGGTGEKSAINLGDGNLWATGGVDLTSRLLTEVDVG